MAEETERERIQHELAQIRRQRRRHIDETFEDLQYDTETHGFRRRERALIEMLRRDLEMLYELREHLLRLRLRTEELTERLEDLNTSKDAAT